MHSHSKHEFQEQINELYQLVEQEKTIPISEFIREIEQIGEQIIHSHDYLCEEIQRLKDIFDFNYEKLNYANDLRTIDNRTLTKFKRKFQDLTKLLLFIQKKETNALNLIQILRINTSRLWHIFETATGSTLFQEIRKEDLEKLVNYVEKEKKEQTINLIRLEKEHGDLLVKLKEIQLSIEQFRTSILQIANNINELKFKIQQQQQINNNENENLLKIQNNFNFNTKNIQILLNDHKITMNEINSLLKLIFYNQTQLEIHHKSIFIYQTKLNKYKQDLILNKLIQINYKGQKNDLEKNLERLEQNFGQHEYQQKQIIENRQHLHKQIQTIENEIEFILNDQQTLLENIKQKSKINNSLNKNIFLSSQSMRQIRQTYRQLIKDQNKKNDRLIGLQKIIKTHENLITLTKNEVNRLNENIKQQNRTIADDEYQIDQRTKDLHDLENCLLTTRDELLNQRTKFNENKLKMKIIQQNFHKSQSDEKPVVKEISSYQRQIIENQIENKKLNSTLKQNQTKIGQYQTIISKLIFENKEIDRNLAQENMILKKYHHRTELTKLHINKIDDDLKKSEFVCKTLQKTFYSMKNQNQQLKQQYSNLTFVLQLLSLKQTMYNQKLNSSYRIIKQLSVQHLEKDQSIEQLKSDLNILSKYYSSLKSYNQQLRESLSITSEKTYQSFYSQSFLNRMNNIHMKNVVIKPSDYFRRMIAYSSDEYDQISKLYLIKRRYIKQSAELVNLKKVFHEKEHLVNCLNQTYLRREKLIEKFSHSISFKDQLIKHKMLKNKLKQNLDKCIVNI